MTAKLEIKNASRITYGKSGYRADRVAMVSGVTGNPESLLFNAINDTRLPRYGDPHPTIPGITLKNIVADPLGGGRYRVVMSYFNDLGSGTAASGVTSRASAGTAVEQVNVDLDGNRMYTQYWIGGTLITRFFTAEVERPRITFDFTYNVSKFPRDTINTYLGKINGARWNDYPIRTILCTAINVDQRAEEYQVRVSLAHNVETWDFQGTITQTSINNTGLVTADPALNIDSGLRPYQVYETVDFSPLQLVL